MLGVSDLDTHNMFTFTQDQHALSRAICLTPSPIYVFP